jgi:hypothetical protein
VDPSKIQDVLSKEVPKNVTKIRSFLGLAGHYRRFIQGFCKISKPMAKLLKRIRNLNGQPSAKLVFKS